MNYEDLSEKEKQKWEEVAVVMNRQPARIRFQLRGMMLTKCYFHKCQKELGVPMINPDGQLNGKYAFHIYEAHGIDSEGYWEMIETALKEYEEKNEGN